MTDPPIYTRKCPRCEKSMLLSYFPSKDSCCLFCEKIMDASPMKKAEFRDRISKADSFETWKFNHGKPDSEKHPVTISMQKRLRLCPASRLLQRTRSSAKTRGHEHGVTKQDIENCFVENCPYFGFELDYSVNPRGEVPYNAATVDRIDSTQGYIPGNIQIISFLANKAKTDLTLEELVIFANSIIRIHGSDPDLVDVIYPYDD